jgi:hypothetical protein
MLEWHKHIGVDPANAVVILVMKLFKTTWKTTFFDFDVPNEQKVFYKVCAINNVSEEMWRESASKVQKINISSQFA